MTLPPPDAAFRWTIEPWGAALRCDPLSLLAQHVFTSRQLGLRSTGDVQTEEWASLARSIGADPGRIARVRQVHGNQVRVVPSNADRHATGPLDLVPRAEADALVTRAPGLALAVQVADCVPLLIADERTGGVSAVHAGWRGTSARVAPAAIAAMVRTFATQPGELTVAIGPSIGACCYEVGPELRDRFAESGHPSTDIARWFTCLMGQGLASEQSWRLDVAQANRDQLVAAGVRADRIFACGLCTKCRPDVFDSYRADQARAGRMAAVIACPG